MKDGGGLGKNDRSSLDHVSTTTTNHSPLNLHALALMSVQTTPQIIDNPPKTSICLNPVGGGDISNNSGGSGDGGGAARVD